MKGDMLQRSLAELRTAAGDEAMHDLFDAARFALLRQPEAGGELAGAIGATPRETEPDETALFLFSGALDAARMAAENDQADGQRFLDAVEAHLGELAAAGALTTAGRLALASAFVRAGLRASPHLALDPGDPDFEPAPAGNLEEVLESLRKDAGSDPAAVYDAMSITLAAMPPEMRAATVELIASRGEEVFARAAGYWLLDRDAGLRRAAAEGIRQRAEAGGLDAGAAARLTLVRPWLPADAARDALDGAIRAGLRRKPSGTAPKPWKLHRTIASMPDGSGSQSIAVAAQAGGRRAVAMVLLKQGFGVRDAFIRACESASEQRRMLAVIADEAGGRDVKPGFLRDVLAAALGEDLPPAPALIDVAEICGLEALRPEASSVAELIAGIDPEGRVAAMGPREIARSVAASAEWMDRYPVLDSWFEDSTPVREILAGRGSRAARLRAIRAVLEGRRGWWGRIIARAAATLHAAGDPAWIEFAATAHALETGRELTKIPIMQDIAEWTLERPSASEFADADSDASFPAHEVEPERPGEFARFFKGSELTPDWVDGFLMAVVVAPKMIRGGEWLDLLIDAMAEFRSRQSLQRFLDIVMQRYNAAVDDADDAERLKGRFRGRGPEAASAWADGFTTVTRLVRSAWTDKSLGKLDKAMLTLVGDAGTSVADAARLDTLLPDWLVRRYRLRK